MAFLSPKLFDCYFHNAVEGTQLHQMHGLMYPPIWRDRNMRYCTKESFSNSREVKTGLCVKVGGDSHLFVRG